MYLRYAKPYLPAALLITFVCWWLVYDVGPAVINGVLSLKVFTMFVGLTFLERRHRFDIFFYQNIGYGERQLLVVTAIADLLLWLVGIIILVNTLF